MKRVLGAALLCAQEIVGWERFTMCVCRLNLSEELVVASCLEVAEVQEEIRDRERKETLKAAKKLMRDFVIWRRTCQSLGFHRPRVLIRDIAEAVRGLDAGL